MAFLTSTLRAWADLRRFHRLQRSRRQLVVYSEGRAYSIYFKPILDALRTRYVQQIPYVTSDVTDPWLESPPVNVIPFFIGDGVARTLWFQALEADVLAMTMPDLECFHIKRSARVGQYCYIHHAIVSTHMVYRQTAFDFFDTIFCVGPHHVAETQARETYAGLGHRKRLIEHGYGPLDLLMSGPRHTKNDGLSVLVAPTWGPNSLLENVGERVCAKLLDAGIRVTLRPHSRSYKVNASALARIRATYRNNSNFKFDEHIDSRAAYMAADAMVSDWSGAALEFALGLERPVVFIDVPRKVNNPQWSDLGIEPIEASAREQVGKTLSPEDLDALPDFVVALAFDQALVKKIQAFRNKIIFNVGHSGEVGASSLLALLASYDGSQAIDIEETVAGMVDSDWKGTASNIVTLNRIARKIDLTGKLDARYDSHWKPISGAPSAESKTLAMVANLMLALAEHDSKAIALKRLNTVLKLTDIAPLATERQRKTALRLLERQCV